MSYGTSSVVLRLAVVASLALHASAVAPGNLALSDACTQTGSECGTFSVHLLQSQAKAHPRRVLKGTEEAQKPAKKFHSDEPCLDFPVGNISYGSVFGLMFLGTCLVAALCWFLATPVATEPAPLANGHVADGRGPQPNGAQPSGAQPNGAAGGVLDAAGRQAGKLGAAKERARRTPQILCLDGMRTIYIILVISYHSHTTLGRFEKKLPMIFHNAEWAMQFFFALSGFVAVYTKADEKLEKPSGAAHFIARRIARISPIYLFCVWWNACAEMLFRSPMNTTTPMQFVQSWPLQTLMVQSLFPFRICQGVVWGFEPSLVGWFVSAIMFLSALFPLLCRLLPTRSVQKTLGLLAFTIVLRSVPTFLKQFLPPSENGYQGFVMMYQFMPLRIPEFFGGMLTARLFQEASPAVVSWFGWAWVAEAIVILSPVWVYTCYPDEMGLAYGDFLLTGPFCLLCFAACCASQETDTPNGGLLLRVLASPPLVWLSEYAYGAYLTQDIFFHSAMNFMFLERPANYIMKLVVSTPLCFFASYLLIEVEKNVASLVEQRIRGKKIF